MSTEQTPSVTYPTFHPPQNQNPNQPHIIYVPQIVYPQQQVDGQPKPVCCQPQQVYSQIQQPLLAQQPYVNIQGDAQQQGYVAVDHEPQLIKEASIKDKLNLAFRATGLLLVTILVSLNLLLFSICNYNFRNFQYDSYSKRLYFPFYFLLVIFVSTVVYSFKNFETARKSLTSYVIFTISFALLWLGAFPSGFTKYYSSCDLYIQTLWTINAFMQAIVTFRRKNLTIKVPNLVYTLILFAYKIDGTFIVISFITSIVIGFYYISALKTFLSKGFKDLKTDEYRISSILIFGQMFVPSQNQDN